MSHSRHASSPRGLRLPRRRFLQGAAAAAALFGLPPIARAQTSGKKLILISASGGWDVTFHLDPKANNLSVIDVPEGLVRTAGGLNYFDATSCNGVVHSFFTQHADVASIVRGISVRSISHDVCMRRILTGAPAEDAPDMGVITGATFGASLPAPYLTLGSTSFPGNLEGASVRQGFTNQLALAHTVGEFTPDATEQALIDGYNRTNANRMRDAVGQRGLNQRKVDDYLSSIDRVNGLREQRQFLGQPFAVNNTLQAQMDDALALLERDVTWAVNLSTGMVWDHHDPNAAPTGTYDGAQGQRNQELWPALAYLADQLKTRDGSTPGSKLIDETVVVVFSEMTRTPKLNGVGGKDHWPVTSAMVFGGGAAAGRVIGETDDTLLGVPIDFATGNASASGSIMETNHFVSGVLDLVGVDPDSHLPGSPVLTALRA